MKKLSKEAQREAAHKIGEAASSDIAAMIAESPELFSDMETGYDISELKNGWLIIRAGQDVRIFVDEFGEQQYTAPSAFLADEAGW